MSKIAAPTIRYEMVDRGIECVRQMRSRGMSLGAVAAALKLCTEEEIGIIAEMSRTKREVLMALRGNLDLV